MDWFYGVLILSDQWSFITSKSFTNPFYVISIDSCLYITFYSNVWKVDQDLNILVNYNPGGNPNYVKNSFGL